jgi:hypothetical protein
MTTHPPYVPAYLRPDFAQSLDRSRPRTLLTNHPSRSPDLRYRYDDSGQTVTVPNIWYNQTIEARAGHLRWQAENYEIRAAALRANKPYWLAPQLVLKLADRLMTRGLVYREVAKRLEHDREEFFFQVTDHLTQLNSAHSELCGE